MYAFRNLTLDTKDYNDEEFMNSREPIYIKDVGYRIKILDFEKNSGLDTTVEEKFYFSDVNDVVLFCFSVANKESFIELKEVCFLHFYFSNFRVLKGFSF
jgi:hypothetical protein